MKDQFQALTPAEIARVSLRLQQHFADHPQAVGPTSVGLVRLLRSAGPVVPAAKPVRPEPPPTLVVQASSVEFSLPETERQLREQNAALTAERDRLAVSAERHSVQHEEERLKRQVLEQRVATRDHEATKSREAKKIAETRAETAESRARELENAVEAAKRLLTETERKLTTATADLDRVKRTVREHAEALEWGGANRQIGAESACPGCGGANVNKYARAHPSVGHRAGCVVQARVKSLLAAVGVVT